MTHAFSSDFDSRQTNKKKMKKWRKKTWPEKKKKNMSKKLPWREILLPLIKGPQKAEDTAILSQIWPTKPKQVSISPEEHERRVFIAKTWCRYCHSVSLQKQKDAKKLKLSVTHAKNELMALKPELASALSKLPPQKIPTELHPPYFTPPIPNFFHGKRDL